MLARTTRAWLNYRSVPRGRQRPCNAATIVRHRCGWIGEPPALGADRRTIWRRSYVRIATGWHWRLAGYSCTSTETRPCGRLADRRSRSGQPEREGGPLHINFPRIVLRSKFSSSLSLTLALRILGPAHQRTMAQARQWGNRGEQRGRFGRDIAGAPSDDQASVCKRSRSGRDHRASSTSLMRYD